MPRRSIPPPLVVVGVLACLTVSFVAADSLYNSSDNVLELDVNSFNNSVYNQPRAFFIEFYSSWCGHCINYKPKWVEFATKLKEFSPVVQVTVVNCADEKNSPICRAHSIDAFPTIKYFPPQSTSPADGKKYSGDKYDLNKMTLDVVQMAYDDRDRAAGSPAWPTFALEGSDETVESLWQKCDVSKQLLVIVIDDEPHLTGFSTLLGYHRSPVVAAAVISSTHSIARQFGGLSLPGVLIFKRDNLLAPEYISQGSQTFASIQKQVSNFLEGIQESQHQAPLPSINGVQPRDSEALKANADAVPIDWGQFKVQQMDLTSAMYYMLWQEIPRRQVIEGESLDALKAWMHVLRKYAPGTAPIRRFFYRLDEWVAQESSVTAEKWISMVNDIQRELGNPLPSDAKWLACKGSKSNLRGYTCGLWTLLHAVTVRAYLDEKSNPNFNPREEILEPVHQFIYRYLSCEICGQNFHKMTNKNRLDLVSTHEDGVIWLWRAHNTVNKRLSGDGGEDPRFPKRQFPPPGLCHDCEVNGVYQEDKILDFLIRYYTDIRLDGVVDKTGYKLSEFENGKLNKKIDKQFNPKFAIHNDKIDRLEAAEKRLKGFDATAKHTWKTLDSAAYPQVNGEEPNHLTFYLVWIVIVGAALLVAAFKYRRNRSKFWKTFYYYNDYKLFSWSANDKSKYVA